MNTPKRLPKLIVFDLDYTLWPYWVDTHVTPPFRVVRNAVVDNRGMKVRYYPEVPQVLERVSGLQVEMALASRTSELEGANALIQLFQWSKYFTHKEIYPGSKVDHFQQLKSKTQYEYEEMLFFDDEHRNTEEVSELNVTCILVENGMNLRELQKGLEIFASK